MMTAIMVKMLRSFDLKVISNTTWKSSRGEGKGRREASSPGVASLSLYIYTHIHQALLVKEIMFAHKKNKNSPA